MASFQENIIIISDMVKYQIGFLTVILQNIISLFILSLSLLLLNAHLTPFS